jgi:hypothetical protein
MTWRGVARIRELGTPRYWQRRRLYGERNQRWAGRLSRVRAWSQSSATGAQAAWRLLRSSLATIAVAVLAVVIVEVVSVAVRLSPWGASNPLFNAPGNGLQNAVSSLIGAAVAVAATLLGLYYTTVGVIASTIYKSVPGDVRDLFITERNSEVYLKVVVQTIAVGVLILVAAAFGYDVAGLTLLIEGLLVALTCIGLVVVTKHLFEYFDPSKLSAPLLRDIVGAVKVVTRSRTRGVAPRQQEAHYAAYRALASFRHLAEMLDAPDLRNATAPVSLSRQLLMVLRFYSDWKYTIPTDSKWWDRVPKHQNWLTIDHTRLEMALNTSVSYPAEMEPDYLWVENTVARLLRTTLSVAFRSQSGANALAISEEVSQLLYLLAARMQIDEALALEAAWDQVVLSVTTTPAVAAPDADDYEIRLNQMAAAESLVRPLTTMLLGLERAAQMVLNRDLSAEFDAAVTDPDALYRGTLPTGTRQMLENFAAAVRRETAIEGKRISPAWWINHLAARSMAEALLATEAGLLGAVHSRTLDQVAQFRAAKRFDLAAITGMGALELLHKIEFHTPTIRAAEARLASFRNANTSIEQWPERASTEFDPSVAHMEMLKTLSELLPELRTIKFNPREPDLYGQLYQFTVDGAFRAIIEGDTERGLAMYGAALLEMDPARLRIVADLERRDPALMTAYAIEPVITAMDLAGYALLMHELDGTDIWPKVRAVWDGLLADHPELAEFLRAMAVYADRPMGLTVGGLERSRRSIALRQLLASRGLGRDDDDLWTEEGDLVEPPAPHPSPIVSALAPDRYAMHDDLYALFLVEYLRNHLPADADLGHNARMLAERISRFRARNQDRGDVSDGSGDA